MSTTPVLTPHKARTAPSIQLAHSAESIPDDPNKFRDTWFPPVATSTTIIHDRAWNKVPSNIVTAAHYSVNWSTWGGQYLLVDFWGRAPSVALQLQFYFGIHGCVIPVGFIGLDYFAFTIAGPGEAGGKKKFWRLHLTTNPTQATLKGFKEPFSSPRDFHNHWERVAMEDIPEVPGGRDAYRKAMEDNGHQWYEDESDLPEITSGELSISDW
ncbi:hypothetical protein C8R43DRAFT_1141579 [Mycena crocata]|nr:hypothetical protein C8R43DRAFT_1141579 [Mycena crocata]